MTCINLASVIIGSNIKSIGGFAFTGCSELKDVYCYSEQVPQTINNVFDHSFFDYATLHVPAASIEQYKTTDPWCLFGTIVATDGNMPEPPTPKKCATPTISYANGKLAFTCETEGVEFVSEITDTDIRKFYNAKVSLSVTYTINVFATKDGYDNSEVATATLCWIESDPKKEGVGEDKITELNALPVLIQTQDGNITIQGLEKGTKAFQRHREQGLCQNEWHSPLFCFNHELHELHELFNCCLSANYKFVQFVQFVVWKLFHCFDTSSFSPISQRISW